MPNSHTTLLEMCHSGMASSRYDFSHPAASASSSNRVKILPLREIRRLRRCSTCRGAGSPKAVIFEFERPVRVIERLFAPSERDRLDAREGHDPQVGLFTFFRPVRLRGPQFNPAPGSAADAKPALRLWACLQLLQKLLKGQYHRGHAPGDLAQIVPARIQTRGSERAGCLFQGFQAEPACRALMIIRHCRQIPRRPEAVPVTARASTNLAKAKRQ